MSIIAWLFIGHLVGDWMLQNDWMARHKRGRWWSLQCVVHCVVYTIAIIVAGWLGSGFTLTTRQLGALFLFTFLSHWLIDGFNFAAHWGRLINQTDNDFVRIVVDQTMHLIVLALLVTFMIG